MSFILNVPVKFKLWLKYFLFKLKQNMIVCLKQEVCLLVKIIDFIVFLNASDVKLYNRYG